MSDKSINPADSTPEPPEPPDPYATSDKPFMPSAGKMTATSYSDEFGGTTIGPYKLLQLMGKGGMGAVWMAEQTSPVKRRVAIKIIRPGYGGDQVLARFEAERQALAMMDHPNIAKVLDAGATTGDQPYFVMELVKGIPFTKYCDQENLSPTERIELFIPVCNAVQHAHQKGIIHRDLKPSNVLIALYDGKPMAKVIDFGIAKATHQKLTEHTLFTEVGQIVGTLEYMAPEQAELNNLDIDTRADIYSLGVMLYELLTGSPPFSSKQLRGEAFIEMLRFIREVEPTKPSTKLSKSDNLGAIAAQRNVDAKRLSRLVQGDLDWIVMKCLEKDRARRYETANQLGDELKRYLADEPVQAGPPSVGYRAKKFLRRNKGAVIAAGLVMFALIAGIIGTSVGLVEADKAAGEALLSAEAEKRATKKANDALDAVTAAQQQHALGQVNALRDAAPGSVPAILANLEANRATVLPYLRARFVEESDRAKRMRLALALLPIEPEKVRGELVAWMLQTQDPTETLLVRDSLRPHSDDLTKILWQQSDDPKRPRSERFRALVALASFDAVNPRWQEVAPEVAEELLTANTLHLGIWLQALDPVRRLLLSPLSDVFRGERLVEHRQAAAAVLAVCAADQPHILAELLMDADEKQFSVIFSKSKGHGDQFVSGLLAEIDKQPVLGKAILESKEKRAKRLANAGAALVRMNQPDKVWPLLQHSPDPRTRSYLIHRFAPLGADVKTIAKRLNEEADVTIRRALILSLGEFAKTDWSANDRNVLTKNLQEIYRTAADPGVHAAAEWLLRDWKHDDWLSKVNKDWAADRLGREMKIERIKQTLTKEKEKTPHWYVNGQGQTMVVISALEPFLMGSPLTEAGRNKDEPQHKRLIGRTFAIAAKAVTVRQYRQFDQSHPDTERRAPTPDCPAVNITWFKAAAYCNWLSQEEGIDPKQWCYEINGQGTALRENYLSLSGYRLPTEAEMEFATRAGAVTSRHYGETEELLGKYGWFAQNAGDRSWPVGSKKPNDLGFFDMHGNVWCWCQNRFLDYPPQMGGDTEESLETRKTDRRVLRGGSFLNQTSNVRCADRVSLPPSYQSVTFGFRPARTFPLDGFTAVPP